MIGRKANEDQHVQLLALCRHVVYDTTSPPMQIVKHLLQSQRIQQSTLRVRQSHRIRADDKLLTIAHVRSRIGLDWASRTDFSATTLVLHDEQWARRLGRDGARAL